MSRIIDRRQVLTLLGMGLVVGVTGLIGAEAATKPKQTYSSGEIVDAGQKFFGKTTRGVAEAVEYVFSSQGEPSAYIVGEEGAGAFVGGLRYGEGVIYYKNGTRQKVYWQGPSVGFDFGGNGSRTLVLVYNSSGPRDIYDERFGGVEGSAYLVGGLGVNFQKNKDIILAPIRTGVGARLGANVGYLKYTSKPTWNPF
ncbi:DUF1134 domain-containing protein [Nordella sp. HKS 07]|uniref:DUF1134 domain-containing protein n=1 Tax=Nordella sp. HKS 07 TaxID=2712222 RepID=UPI0013E10727|nr:DUF1134 domain-containing protein [Nordella sp. HKS 07]QIG46695.1 DUF1134 domain-containing protein [Nordella sp. HKS 07]